jgi:hypothetical protein
MGQASRTALFIAMGIYFLWTLATHCFGSGLIEPTRTLEGDRAEPGQLSIFSEPPGLMVMLDGKDVGKTPVHLESVDQGSHGVRIEDQETVILITSGETHRLSFFKGEFIEIPVKEDKPSEKTQTANKKPVQQAGSEQATKENESLEPGFFPLKPGGPIY